MAWQLDSSDLWLDLGCGWVALGSGLLEPLNWPNVSRIWPLGPPDGLAALLTGLLAAWQPSGQACWQPGSPPDRPPDGLAALLTGFWQPGSPPGSLAALLTDLLTAWQPS